MSLRTRVIVGALVGPALCGLTCSVELAPLTADAGEGSAATGTGATGGDASSGTGGSGGQDAAPIDADAAPLGCTECFANVCAQERAACDASPECKKVAICIAGCTTQSCETKCLANAGLDAGASWYTYSACLGDKCMKECGLLGVPGSVGCVKSTCTLPGQKCCMNALLLPFGTASCVSSGAGCDTEATLRCDGPEDCPGQRCCATYQSSGIGLADTKCQSSCNQSSLIVCGDTASACPSGYSCGEGLLRLCLPMGG